MTILHLVILNMKLSTKSVLGNDIFSVICADLSFLHLFSDTRLSVR